MTSKKIFFQDDSIQLLETASSQENLSITESSSPSILKIKRKNKIHTPPPLSPNISVSSSNDVSDLFKAKTKPQLPPVPRPRVGKIIVKDKTDPAKTIETSFSETHSVPSVKSEAISYKEQLRNRFLSVKKQAGSSISHTPVSRASRKSRYSIDDGVLEAENIAIENELKKRAFKSNDVEYDFFCKVFTDEEKGVHKLEEAENKDVQKEEIEEVKDNDKDSIIEFLGLDIPDTDIIEMVSAEKINICEYEKDLFWNRNNLEYNEEEEEEIEVRNLEDEGIYKADEPSISSRQLNKLKEKLKSDNDRNWFEDGNRLKILPDPRLNTSFKPFKSTDLDTDVIQELETEYVPARVYESIESKQNFDSDNILEIQLYNIKFSHHSLFSPEHVITQKLTELHEQFMEKKNSNKSTTLEKTLDALINAKRRLKINNPNSNELQIEKYQREINELRIKIYDEGKMYRELIKSILQTWKALKIVRDEQKYINTPIKLIINKEYGDYEQEHQKWDANIENEVADIIDNYEKGFQDDLKVYKSDLKEWKAKKKSLTEENEDELPEKPDKPQRDFDIEKITQEVTKKCEESLRHPGEPILDFELIIDKEILTKDIVNPKELLRRSELKKTNIFVRVTCDKQIICKSKIIPLNNNFNCDFNESFSIQLAVKPKLLKMEIYEDSGKLNKRLLFELNLLDKIYFNKDDVNKDMFVKNEKIHHNHTGVGSDINTKEIFKHYDIDILEEILFIKGQINWNVINKNYVNDTEISEISNPFKLLTGSLDIKDILSLSKNFLDPQDPQNVLIHEYIKTLENVDQNQDYFRLDPYSNLLQFCNSSEIENNPRFRMLSLRDKNEPEFQGIIVPNRVKEIPKDAFVAYEKRCAENQSPMVPEDFQKDDIDGQRKWANKYLQIAENKVIQLSKIAENKICLQDVLTEDTIPTLGSLGTTFMNWLQPNRPLRPTRKTTKPIPQTTVSIKEAKIIINIVGAIQVPVRKELDALSTIDPMPLIPVRPFVIASFKDQQARTTVAEGANPIWNQELTLPLENVNEATIHNIHGTLNLNLYDETISDLTEDDRLRHTNIHQQLGYNWLGGINFPISTLLYNKRIEGSFKINSPTILLGYDNNTTQFYSDTVSQRQDTYLTIFVTMQPYVERIRRMQPTLECSEMEYMEEYIKNWEEQYKLLFPNRHFSSLVTNISGETTCVTRFFKPISPPEMDSDVEITQDFCARYVSLIPFRESSLGFKTPNIWLTAEQLLTLSVGSITDHTVLLTCFLMALEVKCWLVIGHGIPYGISTYVLVKEKNSFGKSDYFIYDVETSFKYSIKDNFCPLLKVFCIINNENVWANIQVEERAHMTKYDVRKSSDWSPLFNKTTSAPVLNTQKITIDYMNVPSVKYLQDKIEKRLRQKIMKWRKHNVTIWNHYCSSVLKQILPNLERNCLVGNNIKEHEELQELFNSYKMRGFAVHFPYTSFKELCNYIQETKIHFNENPNTEFAIGVYVHAYPNYNIIVWLFIASLIRRR